MSSIHFRGLKKTVVLSAYLSVMLALIAIPFAGQQAQAATASPPKLYHQAYYYMAVPPAADNEHQTYITDLQMTAGSPLTVVGCKSEHYMLLQTYTDGTFRIRPAGSLSLAVGVAGGKVVLVQDTKATNPVAAIKQVGTNYDKYGYSWAILRFTSVKGKPYLNVPVGAGNTVGLSATSSNGGVHFGKHFKC